MIVVSKEIFLPTEFSKKGSGDTSAKNILKIPKLKARPMNKIRRACFGVLKSINPANTEVTATKTPTLQPRLRYFSKIIPSTNETIDK
jgi:hypothetical protein